MQLHLHRNELYLVSSPQVIAHFGTQVLAIVGRVRLRTVTSFEIVLKIVTVLVVDLEVAVLLIIRQDLNVIDTFITRRH